MQCVAFPTCHGLPRARFWGSGSTALETRQYPVTGSLMMNLGFLGEGKRTYLLVLRAYSWLCAEGLLLAGFKTVYGARDGTGVSRMPGRHLNPSAISLSSL